MNSWSPRLNFSQKLPGGPLVPNVIDVADSKVTLRFWTNGLTPIGLRHCLLFEFIWFCFKNQEIPGAWQAIRNAAECKQSMLILISNILYKRINTTLYREMKVVTFNPCTENSVYIQSSKWIWARSRLSNEQRQVEGKTHFRKTCIYFLTRNYKWPKARTLTTTSTHAKFSFNTMYTHSHSNVLSDTKTTLHIHSQLQNKQQKVDLSTQFLFWRELSLHFRGHVCKLKFIK